jgi:hypothetical protein
MKNAMSTLPALHAVKRIQELLGYSYRQMTGPVCLFWRRMQIAGAAHAEELAAARREAELERIAREAAEAACEAAQAAAQRSAERAAALQRELRAAQEAGAATARQQQESAGFDRLQARKHLHPLSLRHLTLELQSCLQKSEQHMYTQHEQ